MSHAISKASQKLTLWESANDLGWFSVLFATVVGAPSILAITQMAVKGFRLVDGLQWIVDGYNQLTAVMAALIEPFIHPLIVWINSLFGWKLVLYPHWRPLFLLYMIPVTSVIRQALITGVGRYSWPNMYAWTIAGVGFLLGALFSGFVPLDGGWWAQGFIASVPLMLALLFAHFAILLEILIAFAFAFCVFALAAALTFIPGLAVLAGLIVAGGLVILHGADMLRKGTVYNDRRFSRVGLTELGGFVAAGAILAADALVKLLS